MEVLIVYAYIIILSTVLGIYFIVQDKKESKRKKHQPRG